MVYCNHNTETAKGGGSPMRLDKYTAKALGLSRSQAREAIRAGRISLNGAVCRAPDARVPEGAAVACDGRPLCAKEFVYLMLDKPKGVVSAAEDARDTTVVDLVRPAFPRRNLFPAGRLDKTSTGFVLLTDDGAFAHDILAPGRHVEKVYTVLLDTPLTQEMISGFAAEVQLADGSRMLPRWPAGRAGPVQRRGGAAPGRVSPNQTHVRRVRRGRARAAAHGHWRRCAGRRPGPRRLARAHRAGTCAFAGQTFMKQTKNFHICPV